MAEQRQGLERYSQAVDLPLTLLAVVMIPLLLAPLIGNVPRKWDRTIEILDWTIWAVFAGDYLVRLYLAPAKWRFVRGHFPDLIIVVVPFLRPLRLLRSVRLLRFLRLARVAAFVGKGLRGSRNVMKTRGLGYVLLVALGLVLLCAGLIFSFEKGQAEANITSFPDALWWALTTVTTVGYGDRFPVSAGGRGVAVLLMLTGIATFGVLTAAVAAYFVETDETDHVQELRAQLDRIEKSLEEKS